MFYQANVVPVIRFS